MLNSYRLIMGGRLAPLTLEQMISVPVVTLIRAGERPNGVIESDNINSFLRYSGLLASPKEIDQVPPFPGGELVLEWGHAAESQGDGLEDGGVAQSLHQLMFQAGGGRAKLFADRAGLGR